MNRIFTFLLIITLASLQPFTSKSQVVKVADSLALVDLYNSTSGPNWDNHNNWLTGPVDTWFGITVAANGDITAINLFDNNLVGQIPASIGSLKTLQVLDLTDGNFTNKALPAEIGNLTNLQQLKLDNCNIGGSLPAALGNLSSLTYLDVSGNNLTGTLPASLGDLSQLQTFIGYANSISGNIPSSFGNMPNLQYLSLEFNYLTGSIPKELSNAPRLTYLALAGNHLSGDIDTPLFKPTSLKNDMVLGVDDNYYTFTGVEKLHDLPMGRASFNPQDSILPLHYNAGKLSVSAGGTVANNTYDWYNGIDFVKRITGDSTLVPTYNGNYYVLVTNINATGLVLGSTTVTVNDPLLPVRLTSFTGEIIHGASLLNWQTATEINTAYFNVQRSLDGLHFTTVGTVNAAGNSTVVKNYNFTDAYPATQNIIYYRLNEVDKDGKQWTSKTIKLSVNTALTAPLISPNPVTNTLTLKWASAPAQATYVITNAEGKQVLMQKQTANTQQLQLNTRRLSAGTYILTVLTADGQKHSLKFVKQ